MDGRRLTLADRRVTRAYEYELTRCWGVFVKVEEPNKANHSAALALERLHFTSRL